MGDDSLRAAQSPTQPEAPDQHYTLQEAAALLGVDVAQLRLAIKGNNINCSHHYGRFLVSKSDLENYRLRTQAEPADNAEIRQANGNPSAL